MSTSPLRRSVLARRPVVAWAFYDWANSAFATTVMAGFFPVFFKEYWSAGSDALSSTFRTVVLDRRYNANRFGSHIGAGLRLRFGGSRTGIFVEGRRIIADEVDRTAFRFGGLILMGDLHR